MKISFWMPHTKLAGGTRVTLNYADSLAQLGHDVVVVVQSKGYFRRSLGNLFGKKPDWYPHLHAKIQRVKNWRDAEHISSDVVIADSWLVARELIRSNSQAVKFHLIQHDERLYHGAPEEVSKVYASLGLQKIVVSSWVKEILKNDFGVSAHLLLNSIDRTLFHPVTKDAHDEARILLLDHPYEWKGTKEGVEMVIELKKKYPNIRLLGFGARAKNPEVSFDEYYHNLPQEKLAWLYSQADIFLCPSWDEGFGLPSLEAMASGTAVVTYDNGGSRDFAFDGKTAMVAKRRNKQDLKEKLETLVKNPALRDSIAKQGYNFVQTMPTWKEQTARLEAILKNSLS
jgi:glycosyltransferase involved in cell wall biosynthesis